jgi:DNA-binding FadR family transcriptional regulator
MREAISGLRSHGVVESRQGTGALLLRREHAKILKIDLVATSNR